jgi:O-antigen ligase
MPPQIASLITLGFMVWLLARDRALRNCSGSLWIPVLWLSIIGSRPASSWLGLVPANADSEGSPYDRLVFLALIFGAFVVLIRRKVSWAKVAAGNKWLFLLLLYLGISTLWADDPFVSFKRWFKEIGNISMVLVILSEEDPASAVKSVLFRCSVFLIPTSVLLIKYYPDLGRYYNPFIWTYSYGGVTTDKNALGMTLFACATGLYWGLFDLWSQRARHRQEIIAHLLLMGMCLYLFAKANCATALTCSTLGAGILSAMKVPKFQNALQRVGLWGLIGIALLTLLLNAIFNTVEAVVEGLGRNMTLTGRTDIWREVLRVPIDPWIGAGYFNFWQPERAESVSTALGFFFTIKEAHDGYLEVYLNSGLIGLTLVAIVLLGSARRIINELGADDSLQAFRFAVLVGAMLYNITESALCGLVMLWVMLLLVFMKFPRTSNVAADLRFEPESQEDATPA